MKLNGLPVLLALAAVTACAAVFAQSSTPATTAHQDSDFLATANQGSVDEIYLAKLVLTKSTDQDVKAFAQRMIHDHTQLIDGMKTFDAMDGLHVPSSPDADTVAASKHLDTLSGSAFDKAYIEAMVQGHHKVLEAFIVEVKSTTSPAFKTAVEHGAQVVRSHLVLADQDAKKLGVPAAPVPALAM
ncbi:MAG: DUF4142 domain-containing protein [Acidobacteriaceae bacterium]